MPDSLITGASYLLVPVNILFLLLGTALGIVFGANAIIAYVLHGMINNLLAINWGTKKDPASFKSLFIDGFTTMGLDPKTVSLMWAVFLCLFIYAIIYALYRKKIFIRI